GADPQRSARDRGEAQIARSGDTERRGYGHGRPAESRERTFLATGISTGGRQLFENRDRIAGSELSPERVAGGVGPRHRALFSILGRYALVAAFERGGIQTGFVGSRRAADSDLR